MNDYSSNLDVIDNQDLIHYGIMGMKWGLRRYQNADGSYNAAGRERYGVGDGRSYTGVGRSGGSGFVSSQSSHQQRVRATDNRIRGISGKSEAEAQLKKYSTKATHLDKKSAIKQMERDQDDYFKSRISKEARKVTSIGKNGQLVQGTSWGDAYRKGKVTKKDDAEVRKAAKETRAYMEQKYGKRNVQALARSNELFAKYDKLDMDGSKFDQNSQRSEGGGQKKGLSTKQKVAIGVGVGIAAAATTAAVVHHIQKEKAVDEGMNFINSKRKTYEGDVLYNNALKEFRDSIGSTKTGDLDKSEARLMRAYEIGKGSRISKFYTPAENKIGEQRLKVDSMIGAVKGSRQASKAYQQQLTKEAPTAGKTISDTIRNSTSTGKTISDTVRNSTGTGKTITDTIRNVTTSSNTPLTGNKATDDLIRQAQSQGKTVKLNHVNLTFGGSAKPMNSSDIPNINAGSIRGQDAFKEGSKAVDDLTSDFINATWEKLK